MGLLDSSYTNHILHCTFYTGALAYSLKVLKPTSTFSSLAISSTSSSSSSSSPLSFTSSIIPVIIGSIAALNIYSEVNYVIKRSNYLPPGNSGYPIIGHVVSWVTNRRTFLMGQMQKFGCPCTINIGMNPTVVLVSDEDANWAMAQERKGNLIKTQPSHLAKLVGYEAILLQSGATHRRLRRIFEPSFAPNAIRKYVQILDDITNTQFQKWYDTGDFHSTVEWAVLAMRMFYACALEETTDDRVFAKLHRLFLNWMAGMTAIVPFAIPGNCMYKALAARKELGNVLQTLIDDFKSRNPPGSPGAENTMMGRLCYSADEDGKTLTEDQLLTNVRIIVAAGHETTKGSFGSFAHFLVEYPKLQKLLLEEVKGFSEPLDFDELKNAPLLNAFLAETWRHVPVSDLHITKAAVDLEYKGYKIRKDVGVGIDVACDAMMNEDRFPDPFEFRVERWLPKDHPLYDPKYGLKEEIDYNIMSSKYRTFGFGPHMCLGAHFAKLEARIVLTRLLQNYDLEIRNDKLVTGPVRQYTNEFKLIKKTL